MKFYIATRFSYPPLKQKAIEIKETLESHGHTMTLNWMNTPNLRPYKDNTAITAQTTVDDLAAVYAADLFILLPHPEGTGMYVEFGAALTNFALTGSPRIYVLGDNRGCSMFNYHPSAIWKETVEEILADLEEEE